MSDEDLLPDEIWIRRINNEPTGIELVFDEVGQPMYKYTRQASEVVDLKNDLSWIKNRMQSTRDKLNTAIEEIIDIECKVISQNLLQSRQVVDVEMLLKTLEFYAYTGWKPLGLEENSYKSTELDCDKGTRAKMAIDHLASQGHLTAQPVPDGLVLVPSEYIDAMEELIEVAQLRGDQELPHPADEEKLWTARMQDAWSDAIYQVENLRTPPKQEGE